MLHEGIKRFILGNIKKIARLSASEVNELCEIIIKPETVRRI